MPGTNITMLQKVANGLGDLNESVVYVGGSVAELYVTDTSATEVRPTVDIDCVVELASYKNFYELEDILRKKKFRNDTTSGAPICRWLYNGVSVDIMPNDEKIIGFTNKWYKSGMLNKIEKVLPDNRTIFVFPTEYYIATKLEAVNGRGGSDLRTSHDFEDIVYILNNCPEFVEQVSIIDNKDLKDYLGEQFTLFLANPNIKEAIECVLPYGEGERTDIVYEVMKKLSSN